MRTILTKITHILAILIIGGIGVQTISCSSGEDDGKQKPVKKEKITGISQKGPFVKGSAIILYELNDKLSQTGRNFNDIITDDKGNFEIKNIELVSSYAMLQADGYYKNEVTGENSKSPIKLYAIANLEEKSTVNVNILTHLEYYRVQKLIDAGKNLKDAKKQAQREILAVFGISGEFKDSEDMSIFGTTDGDAALLAVSILLQGNRSEAQFTERLTDFSLGFRETGVWNNQAEKDAMAVWAIGADLVSIRNYVQGWDMSSTVPDFEKYIRAYWYAAYGIDKVCDASTANTTVIGKNTEFICRDNAWRLGEKYTEFERDTFGWGSTCNAGTIKQGNVSDKNYICQSNAWKVATDYQLDVGGLGNCSTEGVLMDGKVSGKKYVCEKGSWKLASTDVGFGPCAANNQGMVVKNGTDYYTCDSNVWRPSTSIEKCFENKSCQTFTDARDKQSYRSVKIGDQVWMAENLNYAADSSKCYNNEPANCTIYGRLYNWATAMKACPSSWHLPGKAEWKTLTDYVGTNAGTKLKATSGWNNNGSRPGNGTDDYGFSALPGGDGNSGSFIKAGDNGAWWSISEYDNGSAYLTYMGKDTESANVSNTNKNYLRSVRCVKVTEVAGLPCTASNQGMTANNGTNYYTCDSNDWREATEYESDVYQWVCTEGEVKAGQASGKKYICKNKVWVVAKYIEAKCFESKSCQTFTDARDKQSYYSVKIGEQVWMAENLNYAADSSKCYNNEPANCAIYGRLYNWATAMAIACPSGWHLPSNEEWITLTNFVGSSTAGTKLQATSWGGTDDYGFAALPGGRRTYSGDVFEYAGNNGYWWTATTDPRDCAFVPNSCPHAYNRYMYRADNEFASYDKYDKNYLQSVRCVQN